MGIGKAAHQVCFSVCVSLLRPSSPAYHRSCATVAKRLNLFINFCFLIHKTIIIMACMCLVRTVSQLLWVTFCVNLAGSPGWVCLHVWLNFIAGCVGEGVSGRD